MWAYGELMLATEASYSVVLVGDMNTHVWIDRDYNSALATYNVIKIRLDTDEELLSDCNIHLEMFIHYRDCDTWNDYCISDFTLRDIPDSIGGTLYSVTVVVEDMIYHHEVTSSKLGADTIFDAYVGTKDSIDYDVILMHELDSNAIKTTDSLTILRREGWVIGTGLMIGII